MNPCANKIEIACQQVLKNDSSVFSIQWADFPGHILPTLTPELVLNRYLTYLRKFTMGMVRPKCNSGGLEFRFLETRFYLLSFSPPIVKETDGVRSITYHICGGQFVQRKRCDRGTFSFITRPVDDKVRVTVLLDDYHPRLLGSTSPGRMRKFIYRHSQAWIHRVVTTRFLAFLHSELVEKITGITVYAVSVQIGENI